MPRGYDALRDVLQTANSPTQTKPDIRNLLNTDPRPLSSLLPPQRVPRDSLSPVLQSAPLTPTLTSPRSPASNSNLSMLPVPAIPAAIPYNPINRRTPPTSVLIPLTPEELESFKIPRHALRIRAQRPDPALEDPNFFPPSQRDTSPHRKRERKDDEGEARAMKRSRGSGDSSIYTASQQRLQDPSPQRKRKKEEDDDEAKAAKRSRDSGLVVEHYNARPEVGVVERRESPIIGLKSFNNWVKSVLIAKFSKQAFAHATGGKMRGKVLDMGCGKGGDLLKWQRSRVREYVGLDIAAVSIDQARVRHAQIRGQRFDATFAALDCYTEPLTAALSQETLASPFDAVSMQFCMHYAFESVTKTRMMLENVSKYLRKGGIFLGTIPNAELLMKRVNALPKDASPEFGNSVYRIRFEERHERAQLFGHRYWFYLKDAVEDVPEYVVEWENFEQLALEHGLHLLYKQEFHEMFTAEQKHPEHGPLLQRMKVVSPNGDSQMDEDQWEAADIYLAFAFEKR